MIVCRVLGPVSLEVDGGPAPPELLWRKHLALLVYLARSPRRTRARDHLTGLFWAEKDESAARHSLNEALRVLRRAAGDTALETAAGQVRLAEDAVQLDVDDLERWSAARAWNQAAALIAGEFLEGFAVPGALGFEDWLAAERGHWNGRARDALLGAAEAELARGNAAGAVGFARRAETLDPCSDRVAQAMLTALAVQGEGPAATEYFDRFTDRLTRELGRPPAAATRALAERIRQHRGPSVVASRPDGSSERRRAPLIGRGRELARLLEAGHAADAGQGTVALLLLGDAGSGKTRLLEEFVTRVRLAGATVARFRAVPGDLDQPGSGLLGLARGGLLDAPGLPAAPPAALAAFAAALPDWADRFRPSTAIPALAVSEAFSPILDAAAEAGALVLVLDDAQWLDRVSLLALGAALRDLPNRKLTVLFAMLPEPPRAELDELRRRVGQDLRGAVVGLGPLDAAALRELAAWALPRYDAVALERVARRVASDSAGVPLLAVELLAAVAQGLDLQQGAAAWPEPLRTLSQTLPGDLPDTVIAALRISFRRLSTAAQQTLAAASVLGDRITEPLLARATGLEPAPLEAALAELEWQRWLEADGDGYGFVAQLVKQVIARDMLTAGQRARYRERAGLPPPA